MRMFCAFHANVALTSHMEFLRIQTEVMSIFIRQKQKLNWVRGWLVTQFFARDVSGKRINQTVWVHLGKVQRHGTAMQPNTEKISYQLLLIRSFIDGVAERTTPPGVIINKSDLQTLSGRWSAFTNWQQIMSSQHESDLQACDYFTRPSPLVPLYLNTRITPPPPRHCQPATFHANQLTEISPSTLLHFIRNFSAGHLSSTVAHNQCQLNSRFQL